MTIALTLSSISVAEMTVLLTVATVGDAGSLVGSGAGVGVGEATGDEGEGDGRGAARRRVCAAAKLQNPKTMNRARIVLNEIIEASFPLWRNLSTGRDKFAHSF